MLGFSGGRKLVATSLAAQETIKVLHSPKFMRDARAVEGSIEDNPLHRELLEIAGMARHDFMVDAALTRDRRIAGVFAGNAVEAHKKGVQFVSKVMLELLEEPVDAVITSSAGYPLDLTFYQAIKGITAAQHIVKPGGKILLMAACEEGAGAAEFSKMVSENPSAPRFMDHIAAAPVVVDQWQLEKLGLVTAKYEVLFYTPGLPPEYHKSLWGRSWPSAHAAIEALTGSLPAERLNCRVAWKAPTCLPNWKKLWLLPVEPRFRRLPVDDVPPGADVLRPPVLILQIVCVLPDIEPDDGNLAFHKRAILIGSGKYVQFPAVLYKPGPTRPEPCGSRRIELFLQGCEAAERAVDRRSQVTRRVSAGVRPNDSPEHRVIVVPAPVVPDSRADTSGTAAQLFASNSLYALVRQIRRRLEGLIHISHVSGVVLVVVNLHRHLVYVWFQRIGGIRQGRNGEWHVASFSNESQLKSMIRSPRKLRAYSSLSPIQSGFLAQLSYSRFRFGRFSGQIDQGLKRHRQRSVFFDGDNRHGRLRARGRRDPAKIAARE